jgi:aminopeptidase N
MSNPNRIRSLIGAFASANPSAFHANDGSGYKFLVEMLTDLNTRNPQVAARMIEPLIRLKRYDADRQAMMRSALEQLKDLDKLSGDLYEKISKALNA